MTIKTALTHDNQRLVSCAIKNGMIKHRGLRHLALNVKNVAATSSFYQRVFGMQVVWQPDPDNAYLSSGCDNLALHRGMVGDRSTNSLDHFGFIVPTIDELQAGYQWAVENRVAIERPLRRHRDGSL